MTPLIGVVAAVGAYVAFKTLSKPRDSGTVAAPEPKSGTGAINLAAGMTVVDRSVKNPIEVVGTGARVPSCANCGTSGDTYAPSNSSGSPTAPPEGAEVETEISGEVQGLSYPTDPAVAGTSGGVGEEQVRAGISSLGWTKPYF